MALMVGSPPHMRGKVGQCGDRTNGDGITPAYAGKSKCCRPACTAAWDHPRIYGEKASTPVRNSSQLGSPPHMRGKAYAAAGGQAGGGITPAHAGKSCRFQLDFWLFGDHPRTCGEKYLVMLIWLFRLGSPPHMRGKVAIFQFPSIVVRITPAHAGKSKPVSCCMFRRWDHPRTCGEKRTAFRVSAV